MRTALAAAAQRRAGRGRSASLSVIPPAENSRDYDSELAGVAASILYCSPEPTESGRPVYILNAAAFPDASDVDYDSLLSYVLARLPDEDELLAGTEYEIIFFAGGPPEGASSDKKQGPGMGWYLQAYHVLSRALRKKLQRLYIVHPRTWVRVLVGIFGTIVSPKFRRKIITCNTLSMLALQFPIEKLLIPPSTYLHDRKLSPDIDVPYATGRRAFGAKHPLPKNIETGESRLPRILREATSFILMEPNITTEGIFRIPALATTVNVLKEAYDRGQRYLVWKEPRAVFAHGMDQDRIDEVRVEDAYSVHAAGSLIKAWYRDLQEPIFPSSSYPEIRSRFGDVEKPITSESLTALLGNHSSSPLISAVSRQILTRHLLPLTAAVAARQTQNKMTAENLAICFTLNLICGPNQVEDAQISQILRRMLQSTIQCWPEIRQALQIEENAFHKDLQAPKDPRDYEDPLDTIKRQSALMNEVSTTEHRILLSDNADDSDLEGPPPPLPRRPMPNVVKSNDPAPIAGTELGASIKRKPAPLPSSPSELLMKEFLSQEQAIVYEADSASSRIDPTDTYVTARTPDNLSPGDEKKNSTFLNELNALMSVPKRKAIPRDTHAASSAMDGSSAIDSQSSHATHTALGGLPTISPTSQASKSPTEYGDSDSLFRKPSLPASITRKPPSIQSLAKPVNPAIYTASAAPTIPTIMQPSTAALPSAVIPKHRGPSPGLLARMSSSENVNKTETLPQRKPSLEPRKLNVRKSSVDDLRRLYEERTVTAQGLAQVSALRRASSSASAGL